MSGNTWGKVFRLTSFGESHGLGLGGVVDGCPSGISLTEEMIQEELDRRKPGQGVGSSPRKERDRVQLLSGVFEGETTGTPIGFYIPNEDQRPRDYGKIKDIFRPGHADFSFQAKYGIRDYRGGGRASGRETVSRVAGGAVAGAVLAPHGVRVLAYTLELGGIPAQVTDPEGAFDRPFFAPDPDIVSVWEERIKEVRAKGDSLGGIVEVRALGVPVGLGEPVFDKLDARLAYAFMGVGAVKAVEIGSGLKSARLTGSQNNDSILPDGFASNNAGGTLGGVSSGQDLVIRAAIKPIPSIALDQRTVNIANEPVTISMGGRHDISAIPRINPVLKAMTLLTLADFWLLQRRFG